MLKGYSVKNAPMRFNFIVKNMQERHFHDDVELLYVFDGELEVTVDKEVYHLKKDDFLIINANKFHSYNMSGEVLAGSFLVSYTRLSELTKQTYIVFWCNSTIDRSSAYDDVRKIICELANEYVQNSGVGVIRLVAKYYELLYHITKNFLITSKDTHNDGTLDEDQKRIDEIIRYVAANYRNRISLSELAEMLYLSDAYLSKYIKRHFGMNFLEYLNNVRLNHAVEELLYTDTPITRIALENGFASIATFNKVFKQKYEMTPSAYKYKRGHRKTEDDKQEKDKNAEKILKKLEALLGKYNNEQDLHDDAQKEIVCVNTKNTSEYKKNWCRMINVGTAEDLLRSNMQEHVLELKRKLNFKYVRLWDLYSPEMYIDINAKNQYYNFDKLNRVLDFLVSNNIYPYIELNIKPKKLIQNIRTLLIAGEKKIVFSDSDAVHNFFEALIIHLVDRYGIEETENWYFEFWKEERNEMVNDENFEGESSEEYFKIFRIIWKLFKEYLPNAKFGGAGLSIRYGEKELLDILKDWSKEKGQPDFVSFYCYPYIMGVIDADEVNKTSTDRDFLKNYIIMMKELLGKAGLEAKEIHISEWNSTVSNRNCLNDSCYKGAYILKNLIDSFDTVDVLGYWLASDVYADYYDSTALLNGSIGLLTKDGIRKPSYYAFKFMNSLGSKLVKKGNTYLVTYSGYNKWDIVCHNYKFLNYKYFMSSEDEVELTKQFQYFENTDAAEYEFVLKGVKNGFYQIKAYSINTHHGSVQDEWIKMSCPNNLDNREIEYLKRICVPRVSVHNVKVDNEQLKFNTDLEANEIKYINIEYKLKR